MGKNPFFLSLSGASGTRILLASPVERPVPKAVSLDDPEGGPWEVHCWKLCEAELRSDPRRRAFLRSWAEESQLPKRGRLSRRVGD